MTPFGKLWVSPTSIPVVGSPSIAMSGTCRYGLEVTPSWYEGRANSADVPPPPPYRKPSGFQLAPSADSENLLVPQPVSKSRLFEAPIAAEVPPTLVAYGSDPG